MTRAEIDHEITDSSQQRQLLANGRWNARRSESGEEPSDFRPVVKLFCPWGAATWLLTELDPADPDIAFGLCDLGLGYPEIGTLRLSEIEALRGPGGLKIERDRHFRPSKTLRGYADEASRHGRIVA